MKTREEQITEQAKLSFNGDTPQAAIFASGARWADKHPQTMYVILWRVQDDDVKMWGLWKHIGVKYFRSYEQAHKYAKQFDEWAGKYDIAEIQPYEPQEYGVEILERKSLHY